MIFVKDRRTFVTKKQCELLNCDPLVYDATEDTSSQITVPLGTITNDDMNSWALNQDGLWLIKGVSPQDTNTNVTLELPWRAFSRDHIWDGTTYSSKGVFIAAVIQKEYIEQEDAFYAYPYITISSSDTTKFEAPADESGEIYSLGDYIENAVKVDGLWFDFSVSSRGFGVNIGNRVGTSRTVVFNDGHTLYEGADFGDESVGKVTVIQDGASPIHFYLSGDGGITLNPPSERVEGEWKVISIGEDDIPIDEAEKEFEETINSYKIQWASDKDIYVGDNIRFQLNDGSTHYGKVTYKSYKSSDDLYHYKSGSLKTTLTDKVRSVK